MIKVILHIGRHKTGTSSLQRFLFENPELLANHGLVYPSVFLKRIAHHLLSEPLRPDTINSLSPEKRKAVIAEIREKLCAELTRDDITYIMSSEAFQNVDPAVVREVFDPNIFSVTVVCYFRDQISYLASAYNQRVHATNYFGSIYEYYRGYFRANYYKFAKKWSEEFRTTIFRKYERRDLYKGDLIFDFFKVVFDVELAGSVGVKDGNPSLSAEYVVVKREINRQVENGEIALPGERQAIYRRLAALSEGEGGKKFRVPPLLALIVLTQYYSSNKSFFRTFLPGNAKFSLKPLWDAIKNPVQPRAARQSKVESIVDALKRETQS